MTKYEIIDQVTRFVTRSGAIHDPATLKKAKEEAKDYDFRVISSLPNGPSYYLVINKITGKAYIIIEKDGKFGCSCEGMTFRCIGGTICKHLIRFSQLMSPPSKPLDDADRTILGMMGWTGKDLHPGETQATSDEEGEDVTDDQVPPGTPKPEIPAEPEMVTAKCKWCGMSATRKDQTTADAWCDKHEAGCQKNPVNKKDVPAPSMMTANCQYCGKEIRRKLAADLKKALDRHEVQCPERPKEQNAKEEDTMRQPDQKSTAVSTGRDMPDERAFTTEKVRRYTENRGGFYKNQRGEEVPDSAAMSLYALDSCRISTETVLIEKNADQAKAIVRGHKGDVSVDASVILRFDVLRRRELLKMAKKYPQAILSWSDQMMPNLDLNFVLKDRTPTILLGEHMMNFALDQEQFADRTAETLARRRVFDMLTGVDWRDAVEIAIEDADASSMGSEKR